MRPIVLVLVTAVAVLVPASRAQDRGATPVHNRTQGVSYPTLAQAVADANPHDLIKIDAVQLVEHDILIDKPITILGAGADQTSIYAHSDGRCLVIETGDQLDPVRIVGIKLRAGRSKGANGGNVRVYDSYAIFERCRIESGQAQFASGGAMYAAYSLVTLDACVITDNTASDVAAIYAPDSGLALANCVVTGNRATTGPCHGFRLGGVNVVSLVNCTIANNANGADPGDYLVDNDFMTFVTNSIVWGNDADVFSPETTFLLLNSSIIEGFDAPGILDVDPLFADAGAGDYRLSPASPAIDAGWNEYLVDPHVQYDFPTYRLADALNQFRFRDDPGTPDTGRQHDPNPTLPSNTPIVDIGAIEFDGVTPDACPADLVEPFGTLDFSDVFEFLTFFGAGCP
ncbi:MAG: right-handed parallel beta-helix repeat-containing protein [Phycisphaerales bacterium]